MNVLKRAYMGLYRQLRARKNLYHLRDRRTFQLILGRTLFESAVTWPEILPCKPRTILDVGANRGDISAQLAILYRPEFIGLVEPLPQMVELLRAKSFAPRQKIFGCALGRTEGKANLNVLQSLPSSSLLEVAPGCDLLFNRPMDKIDTVEVPMRTLDGIFDECNLDELDLLKVDVQGYEPEVFAGGKRTLRKTRFIVTEVSFFEHYKGQELFGEIYNFMHETGFEMIGTFGYCYDSNNLPLQCDVAFVNRELASK